MLTVRQRYRRTDGQRDRQTDRQTDGRTDDLRLRRASTTQGCGLGLDVSVSRPSGDVLTSRLGLVSDKVLNVSVSSRSRTCASRVSSRSRPKRSRRLVSGLGPFRLVETFYTGAPFKTSVLQYALVRSSWLILSNNVDCD